MFKRYGGIILFIFTCIVVVIGSFYYTNLSIAFFWFFFLGLGLILLPKDPATNALQKDKSISVIFFIVYCAYTLFVFLTNYALVNDPTEDFFLASDSLLYWNNIGDVHSLDDVFKLYNSNLEDAGGSIREYRLYNLISLLLAYAGNLVDENHIIIQKYQGVFLGAITIPYIYLMIKKYTDPILAFKSSLLFALLGYVFTFSAVFTRDIHIYFIYTLAGYWVIQYDKTKFGLLKIAVCCFLAYYIRFESGIYLVLFFMATLYLKSRRNKLLIVLAASLIPVVTFFFISTFSIISETVSFYSGLQTEDEVDASSLAKKFSNLPIGIKQVALAAISQTEPVPFYKYLTPPSNVGDETLQKSYNIYRLPQGLSGIFWVFIWSIFFYALFWGRKRLKQLPKEVFVMFVISVLFILATTADINVRRSICVYPFVFLAAMYFYFCMDTERRRKSLRFGLLLLGLLYCVLLIK